MTVIGITGGSGAGKSTALTVLADMGAHIFDCDTIYHELLETSAPMLGDLDQCFPGVVVDGRLRRKALGEIVFRDPEALAALCAITHKYVSQTLDERLALLAESGTTLVAIEAIALIESGIAARCDFTVGILAPAADRVQRIIDREGISAAYATARIESQKPDAFFREHCDAIIENQHTSPAAFAEVCRVLFERLLGV